MKRWLVGLAAVVLVVQGQARAAVYTAIAHWDFEEGSPPRTNDASGNGHDGTLIGSAMWDTDVPPGIGSDYSLLLDGSGDYVDVPDHADLNLLDTSFRLEAWVKLDSYNTDYSTVLAKRSPTSPHPGWYFVVGGTSAYGRPEEQRRLGFGVNGGNFAVSTQGETVVRLDTWTHIAMEFDHPTTEVRFFVDGVQDPATFLGTDITSGAGTGLRIGNDSGHYAHAYALDGRMDDVKISTAQIPEPSTLIIWSLLGGLAIAVGWWRRRKAVAQGQSAVRR